MLPNKKDAAMARLAGNEAKNLRSTQIHYTVQLDEDYACRRIQEDLGIMSAIQAQKICRKMTQVLKEADLTINFRASKVFDKTTWSMQPQGDGFTNYFQGKPGRPIDHNKRINAEEQMFSFAAPQSAQPDVNDRIKKYGDINGDSNMFFNPTSRPNYAALNFAQLSNGAASPYGKSYAVLKDHVRYNATFLHEDSLDTMSRKPEERPNGEDIPLLLADQRNMFRLIRNMSLGLLKALHNVSNGRSYSTESIIPDTAKGAYDYIEAQIMGGVKFNRDIKAMYISESELRQCPKYAKLMISKFANENDIELYYIA